MMGSGAFESPLVSHARMRGLFRGLIETRVLSRAAGRGRGWPKGLEACLVAMAVDLRGGDLVNEDRSGWLTDHVRRLGARAGGAAVSQRELKKTLRAMTGDERRPGLAVADRMLCAVGQAMALKVAGKGVALAYARADALKPAEWTRMLRVAGGDGLPLVLVTLPGAVDLGEAARRCGGSIPVIPVDAGDTLALYRVAQETFLRARANGGTAVIECLDLKTDPVKQMGRQLVMKGVCTQRWVDSVEPGVNLTYERARR